MIGATQGDPPRSRGNECLSVKSEKDGWLGVVGRAWTIIAMIVLCAGDPLGTFLARGRAQQGDRLPEGMVTEVRIEGNSSISTEKIRAKILSRSGQPLDQQKVEADLKSLMGTKWFSDVAPYYEEAPPRSHKYILIFRVREMPVLRHVEFRGRQGIKLKEIEETTDLKVGHRSDPIKTRLARDQIERLYREKGYELAEVRLLEGGNAGDTKIVFQVLRGPQVPDRQRRFQGERLRHRRPALGEGGQPQADPRTRRGKVPPRHARGRRP